ncbi:hypothetical protein MANES_14G171850v8 [Manihot esculenta]|uniref:Uncharacterized protein n=1 Tax=Manihot esculenta TaxID=3983 RepID=A0ACB7GHU0_MANES|nr:hypothetical protein MANES_14G171850v8 [Manihot esculenta]
MQNMQRKAGQGTFGGRFGGRKSLQSRKSGRFGGTFGGRNSQTETKLMHVRRHFRRPKLPDRDESLLSGAGFGRNCQTETKVSFRGQASAAERLASPAMFGGRKSFGCRTWFLPKGRNLAPFAHFASQPSKHASNLFYNTHTQAYMFLWASNHHKPHLQHIKHPHCS